MLPLYKVFSLVVRVFARPIIARTKQIHLSKASQGKSTWLKKGFVTLGGWHHKWDQRIDSKFMGIEKKTSDFFYKPLNDEAALEKGVEFFYEILIYGILITFPVYELYRSTTEANAKSKVQNEKMSYMENQIIEMKQLLENDHQSLEQSVSINQSLQEQMKSFSTTLVKSLEILQQSTNSLSDDIRNMHNQYDVIHQENQQLIQQMEDLQNKQSLE